MITREISQKQIALNLIHSSILDINLNLYLLKSHITRSVIVAVYKSLGDSKGRYLNIKILK